MNPLIYDQLNKIAVAGFTSGPDHSITPTINELPIALVRHYQGSALTYEFISPTYEQVCLANCSKIIFEVASATFFKISAQCKDRTSVYYAEQRKIGTCVACYRYFPQEITKEEALKKICTFPEEFPGYNIKGAFYNRHGVVAIARSRFSNYYLLRALPQDTSMRYINSRMIDNVQQQTTRFLSTTGSTSFECHPEDKEYRLNCETAEQLPPITGCSKEVPRRTLAKLRQECHKLQEDAIMKSGLQLINRTSITASATFLIDTTRRRRAQCFSLQLNGKNLIYPVASPTDGWFTVVNPVQIHFDSLESNLVRITTESRDKTSRQYYVDLSVVKEAGYLVVQPCAPRHLSDCEIMQKILNSDIPTNERAVLIITSVYGIALITLLGGSEEIKEQPAAFSYDWFRNLQYQKRKLYYCPSFGTKLNEETEAKNDNDFDTNYQSFVCRSKNRLVRISVSRLEEGVSVFLNSTTCETSYDTRIQELIDRIKILTILLNQSAGFPRALCNDIINYSFDDLSEFE